MGLFLHPSAGSDIDLLGGGNGNFDPAIDLLLLGNGGLALDVGNDDSGDDDPNQGKCGLDDGGNVKYELSPFATKSSPLSNLRI